jgi:predicted PurR-regulated permease PerM
MSSSPGRAPARSAARDGPSPRAVLRIVAIVVISAVALYLLYLVRVQLGYIVLALFLATCASVPVNVLSRRMRRGFAIAIVYLGIVLIPIGIVAILVPPVVRGAVRLANNLPGYATDLQQAFDENEQLRRLDENYDITGKLRELSDELIAAIGETASALASLGAGLISATFALVTILVLSIFMVAGGNTWVSALLAHRPSREAEAARRAIDRMASAVSGYVGGALLQATVAQSPARGSSSSSRASIALSREITSRKSSGGGSRSGGCGWRRRAASISAAVTAAVITVRKAMPLIITNAPTTRPVPLLGTTSP